MHHTLRYVFAVVIAIGAVFALVSGPGGDGAEGRDPQLARLDALHGDAAVRYLAKNTSLEIEAANTDPEGVADWWDSIPHELKHAFITVEPDSIGNFDGIDYATRDEANRIHLAHSITAAERQLKARPSDVTAKQVLACLLAIKGTLAGSHHPDRYLVSLTDDVPPLAAIAVGNPDTAKLVTYTVPGMGTYTDDMQLWTQSAQNVYDAQAKVGAPKNHSVIAWIDYRTPPPGIDATLGDYAFRGAPVLTADIEGLKAVRIDLPNLPISIIAHSYGTTMSADALAGSGLGLYAFVMLGSAGVEDRIPDAAALSAQHVYAGEAAKDPEAQFGRLSRQDPRSPSFGATVISVDGDAAADLLPVTGHDPVLHSKWNDDITSSAYSGIKSVDAVVDKYLKHFESYGYLDGGTESLENAAIATTPHPNRPLYH